MVTTCLHIRSTPNYKDYYKGQGHRGQGQSHGTAN